MRLETQARKDSTVGMTLSASGVAKFIGNGSATAVVTGDVVDKDNKPIGDLYDIANKAVKGWENLLADFGLISGASGT